MVLQLLTDKEGAFEEIRVLWCKDIDTTEMSAEDEKELLEALANLDIKEKVFANNAPRRLQTSFSSIGKFGIYYTNR